MKLRLPFKIVSNSARRRTVDYANVGMDIPKATDFKIFERYDEDPDFNSAVNRFIDNVLIEVPYLVAENKGSVGEMTLKQYKKQLKDARWYKVMRLAVLHLILTGDAYIEIKFTGRKLTGVYNIDPETMQTRVNDAGEITGYTQVLAGDNIDFSPEEIVHFSINSRDTSVNGAAIVKPLRNALIRKEIAEYYLQWLIQNNKVAPIVVVKGDMNDTQWDRILAQIKAKVSSADNTHVINMMPEDDISIVRLFTFDDIQQVRDYIREQEDDILKILKTPPIISGSVDNSNRSNSEVQARLVFYNTITAFRNWMLEELEYELLSKLNWKGVRFSWPRIDRKEVMDILKEVKVMKDVGFSREAIESYLRENDFVLPDVDELFEEIPDMTPGGVDEDRPSREPRDKAGLPENEAQRQEDKQVGVSVNENQ